MLDCNVVFLLKLSGRWQLILQYMRKREQSPCSEVTSRSVSCTHNICDVELHSLKFVDNYTCNNVLSAAVLLLLLLLLLIIIIIIIVIIIMILLRSSFSVPKVLHLLRCAPSVSHSDLQTFDSLLRDSVLNRTYRMFSDYRLVFSSRMEAWGWDMCLRLQFKLTWRFGPLVLVTFLIPYQLNNRSGTALVFKLIAPR